GFAEELQGPRKGLRAEFVLAERLTSDLDDGRLFGVESGQGFPISDDIDDRRTEPDRDRFHFMKRPLVLLVVLAGCRDDGQFRELPSEGGIPPHIDSRLVKAYRGRSLRHGWRGVDANSGVVGLLSAFIQVLPPDRGKAVARIR